MKVEYRTAIVLVRTLNQWLEEHPDGENAEEVQRIVERLKREYQLDKPYFDYDRQRSE